MVIRIFVLRRFYSKNNIQNKKDPTKGQQAYETVDNH